MALFRSGHDGQVTVGDYCTLVGAIFSTNARISIGDYTFIAHEVTIGDHCVAIPLNLENLREAGVQTDEIRIGEGAWIGAGHFLPALVSVTGAVVGAAQS